MKRFKIMLAVACIGVTLPAMAAGCGKEDAVDLQVNQSDIVLPAAEPTNTVQTDLPAAEPTNTVQTDLSAAEPTNAVQTDLPLPEQSDPDDSTIQAGQEFLSGKVKELNADGFIFSQTILVTDGLVTFLDEEEAEEISVKYTPDTEFEHWTIKGGGAGIEKETISASDITEGMLLEISGHFEDADFIAELVLIEVYE